MRKKNKLYLKIPFKSDKIKLQILLEVKSMNIPNDPAILVSFLNTKLRDFYPSLDALCGDMELDKKELCDKVKVIGYEYSADRNQFI